VVVNLASQEYARAALRPALQARVVDCVFEDWKGGRYKVISFFAKRARGLMARWAIAARAAQRRRRCALRRRRLCLDAEASEPDRLVFRRRVAAGAAKIAAMNTTAAATSNVTPELRRWIIEQAEAGCRPQDVSRP
jgi:hypothetical protein